MKQAARERSEMKRHMGKYADSKIESGWSKPVAFQFSTRRSLVDATGTGGMTSTRFNAEGRKRQRSQRGKSNQPFLFFATFALLGVFAFKEWDRSAANPGSMPRQLARFSVHS